MSAVSVLESAMVIEYKKGEQGVIQFDELIKIIAPTIVAFDGQQAELARVAWRQYGKGRHPAKLNFGDCCSLCRCQIISISRYCLRVMIFREPIWNRHRPVDTEKLSK